ncbi:MAG: alpha/beta fold hydrolase [Anaerolineaceae bacterium]|nr:alpha/beta fold hydrolase [Anaerolineaceae bacterium]
MQNNHESFSIETSTSEMVTLYIHGIMGSPLEFRRIAETLKDENIYFKALLLPGHGSNGYNFARTSANTWQSHVNQEIQNLKNNYSKIILIGHSLGGLLALNASLLYPVDGIVLLNTPIKTRISIQQISMSLRVLLSSENTNDPMIRTYRETFSVALNDWWTMPLWLPRLLDINRIARETAKILNKVDVPVIIFQSIHDETVNPISAEILKRGLGNHLISLSYLNKSTHAYFINEEFNDIIKGIKDFSDSLKVVNSS